MKRKIGELLNLPSNYQIKNGKLFIIFLDRFKVDNEAVLIQLLDAVSSATIKSFSSISDCAKLLKIARFTVNNRALKGKSFLLEGRSVRINYSKVMDQQL